MFAVDRRRGARLRSNSVSLNTGDGIVVSGQHNFIQTSKAKNNGGTDLVDTNASCDTNHWEANSFGTRSQTCID